MNYEEQTREELRRWLRKMEKSESLGSKFAKRMQKKMNQLIPEKVQHMFTVSIKKMVQAALVGSEYTTKVKKVEGLTFEEQERMVYKTIDNYKKAAAIEGAGTGAGGILLGLADFPLLLSIKMKFLFEVASCYSFDVRDFQERLYILYLFQLAFSSEEKKKEVLETILDWDLYVKTLPEEKEYLENIDWESFQIEYRDHIDLVKILQLIPGFGAIVGAAANYHFLDVLGEVAMNGYRLRIIKNF